MSALCDLRGRNIHIPYGPHDIGHHIARVGFMVQWPVGLWRKGEGELGRGLGGLVRLQREELGWRRIWGVRLERERSRG
ncbi:hypothetical protein Ancab_004134 [Ancistrocladus abbreviatus]